MKNKWKKDTLLRITREFSQIEKYNILVLSYQEMVNKLQNYKKEISKLTEHHISLKKEHVELQEKYTKLTNR